MVNTSKIREHMEVFASCGCRVGTVDRVEGDFLKLDTQRSGGPGGQHHFIPLNWVKAVGRGRCGLDRSSDQVRSDWQTRQQQRPGDGHRWPRLTSKRESGCAGRGNTRPASFKARQFALFTSGKSPGIPRKMSMIYPEKVCAHMAVVAACGNRLGTVAHLQGSLIRLEWDDQGFRGNYRYIPLAWVESVDVA